MKPLALREALEGELDTVAEARETVLELTRQVSVKIGLGYFRAMVTHLAEALHADHVFVGEFAHDLLPRVTILAASVEDEPASMVFELAGRLLPSRRHRQARPVPQECPRALSFRPSALQVAGCRLYSRPAEESRRETHWRNHRELSRAGRKLQHCEIGP